jgi:hypothetical protein
MHERIHFASCAMVELWTDARVELLRRCAADGLLNAVADVYPGARMRNLLGDSTEDISGYRELKWLAE